MKNWTIFLLIITIIIGGISCGTPTTDENIVTSSIIDSLNKDSLIYNQYKDGQKTGLWRSYYSNGILQNEFYYNNGVKEGIGKEWWEDGTLATEGLYANNEANGWMKWYSMKGHLSAIGQMVNGKRNGEWKVCDWQDSTFCTIGNFVDDVTVGTWRSYHDNGQLERENTWKNGTEISSKCWDEAGNIIACQ